MRTKEQRNVYMRQWRLKNLEHAREWGRQNDKKRRSEGWKSPPEARRILDRHQLLKKYGIDEAIYEAMVAAQDGKCAICNLPETSKRCGVVLRLAVDHDHVTGGVRGLLCHRCNRGIGSLGENLESLQRAIDYLIRAREAI
jgi:hypothetical protein